MNRLNLIAAVSVSALASSVALAHGSKEPNCTINGKGEHVKNEKICTSKKGTWITPSTTSSQPSSGAMTPAAAVAPTAVSTAPAATTAPVSTPAK